MLTNNNTCAVERHWNETFVKAFPFLLPRVYVSLVSEFWPTRNMLQTANHTHSLIVPIIYTLVLRNNITCCAKTMKWNVCKSISIFALRVVYLISARVLTHSYHASKHKPSGRIYTRKAKIKRIAITGNCTRVSRVTGSICYWQRLIINLWCAASTESTKIVWALELVVHVMEMQ